ncbi:response regulator [Rhizobium glycinendophyticum]|uniref:response regulator n=1 Tax=Rhizobium glycinendophyticum TaxID=2589807 RepID=UPI00137557CF|nr:PAS-domain containing protein [Rhizobium glycinendophyticum]
MLNLVCEKIAALELPSYVKDSQLRYIAVNAAFARLHGLSEASFPGRNDQDILGVGANAFRDDRERRVLVFGDEETLPFSVGSSAPHRLLRIERFFDEDERLYLFGLIEAEVRSETPMQPANGGPARFEAPQAPHLDVFKAVLEQYPLASYVRDSQHRLIFANPAYVEMAGRPLEELLGRNEIENFPEMGESYHLGNMRVLATGVTEEVHDTFVSAEGREIPILSRTGVVDGPDGARYLVGSITDLSQLRRGEEKFIAATRAAEELKSKFESLMTSLPVGILVLDPSMHVEYINAAMVEMFELGEQISVEGKYYGDILRVAFARVMHAATEQEIEERVAFRLDQLRCLDNGPLIDARTPSGRALAGGSRKIAGGRIMITFSDVSDLAEREEETLLYRTALEQMPVPVFIRDTERRLIYVNAAYERLHECKREDVYGLTVEEMFPSNTKRIADNIRVLEKGETVENANDVVSLKDRDIPTITRLNLITTSRNKQYIVGSVTDVSIIREGQAALVAAQERAEGLYRDILAMLHVMPVGVVILGPDYMVEFANRKCRDIWNWPDDVPLEGQSFRFYCEINHRDGRAWPGMDFEEGYRRRIAQFDALEGSHSTELAYEDGKHVLATVTRLRDRKILLTYADLTEMRQREREVDAAQQQVARIGQFMRDTLLLTSQGIAVIEGGRIAEINPAFQRILSLPEDLVQIGTETQAIFDFCAARGDFGDEAEAVWNNLNNNVGNASGASLTFLADGRTWVKFNATFGENESYVVILTDVTEVKVREAELEVLLARSEAADKAKSDFLANMSHEIRTPMNGVLGMAELLSKSELDSRQKTFVDIVVKSGNALLTIINDILDFSKIDAGQMKLRKSPFDPIEAIEDVATLLSAAAAEKDIELVVSGEQTVHHTFMGDPGRFRQIVTNLLGNAIKFTERGHVHVEVSSEPLTDGMAMLQLRIEDTGIGIPDDMQAKIFEKFSQADTSSTRRHEGTGLGLAITGGLVKLFGGQIRVESEVGVGSAFIVEMPLPVVAERSRNKELPPNIKGARVLVIDDNIVNRRIISEQLAMWGFDGLAVADGPSGIAILDEAHREGLSIDLVVIDYQMPEMNGLDVARAIRNDPRFDETALIFLTSMDMAGDERLYESLRIQAHLMKPARANVLRGAIIDVIRSARVHGVVSARSRIMDEPTPTPLTAMTPHPQAPVESDQRADPVLKVLIAEDNAVNQIVFRQILAGSDIAYRIVENGAEALDAWRSERPDLILMDVSMPVMNGHRATEAIRGEEQATGLGEHVPIIGVTAHAMASDREACLASGMDDYLSKPISPELLMRKIEDWSHGIRPIANRAESY